MKFEWIKKQDLPAELISSFDSGNEQFNLFLTDYSDRWACNGESVSYVCVLSDELHHKTVKRIFGYAALNTTGLLYSTNGKNKYLNCAEIRMFAIAKQLRKHHDPTIQWSNMIFKSLLQFLYEMSTSTIGFKAIFLNANHEGYQLYKDCGFSEITEFISPDEEDKLEISGCIPLLLIINDDVLYNIYGS